jgi:hypothetical protein
MPRTGQDFWSKGQLDVETGVTGTLEESRISLVLALPFLSPVFFAAKR